MDYDMWRNPEGYVLRRDWHYAMALKLSIEK
jgi:hypothetical protein